jgi:hypothetical protein
MSYYSISEDAIVDGTATPWVHVAANARIEGVNGRELTLARLSIASGIDVTAVNVRVTTHLTIGARSFLHPPIGSTTTNITVSSQATIEFRAHTNGGFLGSLDLGTLTDSPEGHNMAPQAITVTGPSDFSLKGFDERDLIVGTNFLNCDRYWRSRFHSALLSRAYVTCSDTNVTEEFDAEVPRQYMTIEAIALPTATEEPDDPVVLGVVTAVGVFVVLGIAGGLAYYFLIKKREGEGPVYRGSMGENPLFIEGANAQLPAGGMSLHEDAGLAEGTTRNPFGAPRGIEGAADEL